MTTWSNITIGRMTLRETFELAANISAGTDTRTLVLAGQESAPPLTFAEVKRRQEDILGLQNKLVPIQFGTKSDHNGWYRISDVNTSVVDYQGDEVRSFNWGLSADLIGPENGVDIESRLTGISRINDHGLTGEKWHAPAGGAELYFTGTGNKPSGSVSRSVVDGSSTVTVYRDVPASANPRWYSSLADYGVGRCRIYDDGYERSGTNISLVNQAWTISNGIVRASISGSDATSWTIAHWDGTAWDSGDWNVGFSSSTNMTSTFNGGATVLRNDYEMVTVRFADNDNPGRRVVDWTLRRGSRFIEGRIQMDESGILAVWPATSQASTASASTGYVRATSNDAQGNRYVCGSARSFTGLTAAGGLSKASTTSLDFFIGAEVGGSAAVTGDQAANLVAQYLTAMSETTLAALR